MSRLRLLVALLLCALLPSAPAQGGVAALRRVNATYSSSSSVNWSDAAIFWFGKVDASRSSGEPIPGRNYADVRVAYTPQNLQVFVTVVDYYLWMSEDTEASLSTVQQFDALALYIDRDADRAGTPQADDYLFVSGFGQQRRQLRGTGSGWDAAWGGTWSHTIGAQWSADPGPNSNAGTIDYGWASTFTIPWSTLGLSGPPTGSRFGMGLELYDRDAPGAGGMAALQRWPEGASPNQPGTWGEVAFGVQSYVPVLAQPEGSVAIARGLAGSSVADSTVGGNGNCVNGHEGEPETFNQGDDTSLYMASQSAITDFPCFARSYLRFNLNQVPPGKAIISAQLTLYHWTQSGNIGSSNPDDRPQPSLIHLFRVDGGWSESSITWNNSPLAIENLGAVWVSPRQPTANLFPGVPYTWDATAAVAQAYANGQPLDLALYTSATEMHSNKAFTSSETEDWNAVARPRLVVTWGTPTGEAAREHLPLIVR